MPDEDEFQEADFDEARMELLASDKTDEEVLAELLDWGAADPEHARELIAMRPEFRQRWREHYDRPE